jgi:hypothetical protein
MVKEKIYKEKASDIQGLFLFLSMITNILNHITVFFGSARSPKKFNYYLRLQASGYSMDDAIKEVERRFY